MRRIACLARPSVCGVRRFTSVPPSAAAAALAEARASFIDVRAPAEYTVAHARGFQNVPYAQLGAHTPAQDVYVMDDFGYYAEKAARELEAKGATVHVVDGGLFAWAYAGGMLEGQVAQLSERVHLTRTQLTPELAEQAGKEAGVDVDTGSLDPDFPQLKYLLRYNDDWQQWYKEQDASSARKSK